MTPQAISIVWFKRDLRLQDHEPLRQALQAGWPVLLLYIFEPSIMAEDHSSKRHWRFVRQSLEDLQGRLQPQGHSLEVLKGEAWQVFHCLTARYDVQKVYSHLEVGLKITYDRDESIRHLLHEQGIPWEETPQDGIQPKSTSRRGWEENRLAYLENPLAQPPWEQARTVSLPRHITQQFPLQSLGWHILQDKPAFQTGGMGAAHAALARFLGGNYGWYLALMSKPSLSRDICSRLSPYLAYGCISVREVHQAVTQKISELYQGNDNLEQYLIRLFWRSHYIQKLETEYGMQFEPTNRALSHVEREYDPTLFQAWATGQTGYPIIDATIRCLEQTGYVNFRMRATLVTFATFSLWQDWRKVAKHLARLFLDFEPGIHYGQIHIQAGLTGYHTLRVFNPSAQSAKHDPEGEFVKEWLPELRHIPQGKVAKPWQLSRSEQQEYGCIIGQDYPEPIVDYEIATRIAKGYYWKSRQRQEVFDELPAIFQRHCLPRNIPEYERFRQLNMEAYQKAQQFLQRRKQRGR